LIFKISTFFFRYSIKEKSFSIIKTYDKQNLPKRFQIEKEYFMDLFLYCYIRVSKTYNGMHNYFLQVLSKNNSIFNCSNLNACISKPCDRIDYAVNNSCKLLTGPTGIFVSSFTCKCLNDNFEWSNQIKKCIPLNKCKYKTFGKEHPCGGIGRSISCKLINYNRYQCECKSGWMGDNCSEPFDACLKSIHHLLLFLF
jgi:hypothetical protein